MTTYEGGSDSTWKGDDFDDRARTTLVNGANRSFGGLVGDNVRSGFDFMTMTFFRGEQMPVATCS